MTACLDLRFDWRGQFETTVTPVFFKSLTKYTTFSTTSSQGFFDETLLRLFALVHRLCLSCSPDAKEPVGSAKPKMSSFDLMNPLMNASGQL